MKTYRVTFPLSYPKGSLGFEDVSARQGHYISADSSREAARKSLEKMPRGWQLVHVQSDKFDPAYEAFDLLNDGLPCEITLKNRKAGKVTL